jgi:hypothetical protein
MRPLLTRFKDYFPFDRLAGSGFRSSVEKSFDRQRGFVPRGSVGFARVFPRLKTIVVHCFHIVFSMTAVGLSVISPDDCSGMARFVPSVQHKTAGHVLFMLSP